MNTVSHKKQDSSGTFHQSTMLQKITTLFMILEIFSKKLISDVRTLFDLNLKVVGLSLGKHKFL